MPSPRLAASRCSASLMSRISWRRSRATLRKVRPTAPNMRWSSCARRPGPGVHVPCLMAPGTYAADILPLARAAWKARWTMFGIQGRVEVQSRRR